MTARRALPSATSPRPPRGLTHVAELPGSLDGRHVDGAGQHFAQLFRQELLQRFATMPLPVAPDEGESDAAA